MRITWFDALVGCGAVALALGLQGVIGLWSLAVAGVFAFATGAVSEGVARNRRARR